MKKLLSIVLVLVIAFSSVGCSQMEKESSADKAKQLIKEEEYEEAIEKLEGLVDEDEYNIEAWDLIAEAYIKDEKYEQADEWLLEYLVMVDDNLDNKDFDSLKAIDSIGDYARDILREGGVLGSWYDDFVPKSLSLDELNYEYEMGEVLEFDVPSGLELYYSFYGSPRTDGSKYVDGIVLDGEGYTNLDVVLVNKYGEYSNVSSQGFDVYDPLYYDTDDVDISEYISIDLVLPEVDLEPGTYNENLELRITNYDVDNPNLTIMYTTNGSDPREYTSPVRYYYDSIPLTAGEYDIAIVAYDYDNDIYSEVSFFDYYIDIPDMIKLGLFMLPDTVAEAYKVMFDEAGWYGLFIAPTIYDEVDITTLDEADMPHAFISYGTYAEELSESGLITSIEDYFNLADYDFIGQADNIGMVNGVKYMMPLTIRPEFMVYGDSEGVGQIDWDFIQGESDWYDNKFAFAADSPEYLLGIYYGLGGPIVDANLSNIDKNIMIEALTMIQSLPQVGIGNKLFTLEEIYSGLYDYKNAYFLMGDTIERNPDYYFTQVGQMPLSNGDYAKYYNIATGLFLPKVSVELDPMIKDKMVEIYTYMIQDSYDMNEVAASEGSLPANKFQAEEYEFYLDGSLSDYIAMIDNGISSIRLYNVYILYESMILPLQDFINGATPEDVAESILLNLSNSGN